MKITAIFTKHLPRSVTAFSLLPLLSACPTGNWGNPPAAQANLVSCAQSFSVFNTTGAAEIFSSVEALPRGKYTRANYEVFVDNQVRVSETRTNQAQIQFLERFSGAEDAETSELSLRCREFSGTFVPFSTAVTIPTRLVHYKTGLFDVDYRALDIAYSTATNAQGESSFGGRAAASASDTLARTISLYWTSGVTWVRRSGEVFEFHGRRLEGTRHIYGKATFVRKDLPGDL
jgi:hypothetical protein